MDKLPLYEYKIDEFDEETGMYLVAFVDKPAMQVQAVKLTEHTEHVTLKATDEMKQYLTSAVIIPNKPIYRRDERGEYNAYFSVEGVEKIRNKFFKQTGNLKLSNKNHDGDDVVAAQLIESWIITDEKVDKAVALGFKDLPAGTMMATYHVQDKEFWNNEVMTGNVTGFSLEGMFMNEEVKASEVEKELTFDEKFTSLIELMKGLKDG